MKYQGKPRTKRHRRIRFKIQGTAECPRLSVFRSNQYIWAQLIDDEAGRTMASAGTKNIIEGKKTKDHGKKIILAEKAGETLAKKAAELKITKVVFDRGGYKYHGLVKAVAEGARKGGLKF